MKYKWKALLSPHFRHLFCHSFLFSHFSISPSLDSVPCSPHSLPFTSSSLLTLQKTLSKTWGPWLCIVFPGHSQNSFWHLTQTVCRHLALHLEAGMQLRTITLNRLFRTVSWKTECCCPPSSWKSSKFFNEECRTICLSQDLEKCCMKLYNYPQNGCWVSQHSLVKCSFSNFKLRQCLCDLYLHVIWKLCRFFNKMAKMDKQFSQSSSLEWIILWCHVGGTTIVIKYILLY